MGTLNYICDTLRMQRHAINGLMRANRKSGMVTVIMAGMLIYCGYRITKLEEKMEEIEKTEKDG